MNERSIFMEALDKDTPDQRAAYLDEACASDAALRHRMETLLASHVDADSFLGTPVVERLAAQIATDAGMNATCASAPAGADHSLSFLGPSDKPGSLGRLGSYEIEEVIGRGGMGTVLRAFDEKLHRAVAIKVMTAPLATNEHARRRFIREGRAAAAVRDDHVIGIHGVDETNGLPLLVMEYVVGRSLGQRLEAEGPLPVPDILRIGSQIARGLAAAHAQGLVHRDIKPANILLENGVERVKITDFGLAHAVDDVRTTQPGTVIGTPEYMSPEQARGEKVDYRSDLFSLGCVLYAMCAGRPPFRAESTVAIIRRVCDDTPRPLSEINPDIPDWLVDLIDKLIAKDANERFQSAAEVAELLGQYLAHVQQPAVNPEPAAIAKAKPACCQTRVKTRRGWSVATAAALLLFTGLSLAESTGVTNVAATVIRIVRGDGTLIVEIDDPSIQVLLDGDEIAITGAGPKEVRLRPGQHELQSVKDGKPVETKLVTISRAGREVIKVSRESQLAAHSSPAVTTRLVREGAPEGRGSLSPDGRYIVFYDGDKDDLAVRELATGEVRQLTKKSTWEEPYEYGQLPVFSSDGKHVVSSWLRAKNGDWDLRVVDVADGTSRLIYRNKKDDPVEIYARPYGWTPDDQSILVGLYSSENCQLAFMQASDGAVRVIKTFAGRFRSAAFRLARDGKTVAASIATDTKSANRSLYLIDVQTGKETPIASSPVDHGLIGWTVDGRSLLFTMDRRGSTDIWMIEVADGTPVAEPRLVKSDIGSMWPLGVTPGGSLYYSITRGGPRVFTANLDLEKWSATAAPLEAEKFSFSDGFGFGDWSPDGKEIAYAGHHSDGSNEIRILTLETSKTRLLTPDIHFLHRFRWSPDGRSFITASYQRPGLMGIHQIDATTGIVKTIVEPPEKDFPFYGSARWSPDGKGVYYVKGMKRIVYRDLKSGEEREILDRDNSPFTPGAAPGFAISHDGEWLAVGGAEKDTKKRLLLLISPDGQTLREIKRFDDDYPGMPVDWTPDNRFIVFLGKPNEAGQQGIWRISVEGGEPQKLNMTGFEGSYRHLTLSPDGKHLAFQSIESKKTDLWALEDFLPPLYDSKPAATAAAIPASNSGGNSNSAQTKQNQSGPIVRRVWDKAPKTSLLGGISPDGKHLAFGQEKPFGPQLYIRELDTGKTQLIGEISGVYTPMGIFSPDKKQMSYRWRNEQRIGEFDDQPSRTLIAADEKQVMAASLPQWSNDGKQIIEALYYPSRRAVDITLISIPDRTTRVLKSIDHHPDRAPTVAMPQTGDHVAYSLAPNSQTSNRDIFFVSTNGNGQTSPLIEHPADDFVIAWTPDDKSLLFGSDRSGSVGVWSVRVEGGKAQGNPELLKSQMGPLTPLGMTCAGTLFYALAAQQNDVFIATIDPKTGKLVGSPSVGVPRNEGSNSTPAWSPDGRYLVCRSNLSGTNLPDAAAVFCIRDMQTDGIRVLEPKLRSLSRWSPRWSPDGISLLATGTDLQERRGLFRININTGDATLIAHSGPENGGQIFAPVWSPDGQSVYFVRDAVGKTGSKLPRHIVRRDLATGQEKELHQVPGYVFWMPISPFGNELAFNIGGTLQSLPVTGDEPRVLTQADPGCGICWTPDGRYLFFRHRSADGQIEICRIASTGGEPESTGLTLASSLGITWFPEIHMHPDGKQIAFSNRNDDASEVWALENFLPPLSDGSNSQATADTSAKSN